MPRNSRLQRLRRNPKISATRSESDTIEQPIVGYSTFHNNDTQPRNKWRLAVDGRMPEIGDYETRKANDFYSIPVGEAVAVQQTAVATATIEQVDFANRRAERISGVTEPISAIELNLVNDSSGIGVVAIDIHEDDGGQPGDVIGQSSFASNTIAGTAQYLTARFIEAPKPTGDIWVVVYMQKDGLNTFGVTTTNNSTNASISTDNGQTWVGASYSLNYIVHTATEGEVLGLYRANRPGGTNHTIFAHGDSLYEVDDGTGALTQIATGLAPTERYRFEVMLDKLYYTNGNKPYEYDFTTNTQVTAAPDNAHNLIEYKGFIVYMDTDDRTKIFISEFANPDQFTSTDFIYIDAPKLADELTAFAKLSNLVIFSRNDKHILYGSNRATWSLGDALGQKGTFSQESVAYDANSIYFASDDGIYKFDGAGDILISSDILEDWRALDRKENTVLELHDNRLYVWYTPNGEVTNTRCLVYHLELQTWESNDTLGFVSHSWSRFDKEDLFLQASNKIGAIYYSERDSNDHSSLGAPLNFQLYTNYDVYGTTARYKEVREWFPRFKAGGTGYTVQCAHAFDLQQDGLDQDVQLQPNAVAWDNNTEAWDNNTLAWDGGDKIIEPGIDGITPEIRIDGIHRRVRVGYKHKAAREPVRFLGHTLVAHVLRIR